MAGRRRGEDGGHPPLRIMEGGLFMRIADGAEGDGGGCNGGGIPCPVSNPYILYPLSMLYDSTVASTLYSASFDHF